MRNNSSNRRPRGRNNNNNNNNRRGNSNGGGNNRSQVYDSNGPDVRIRGTAHQVNEKYIALAKDATSSGDMILAQSYLQHAEHYQRIINSWNKEDEAKKAAIQEQNQSQSQNNETAQDTQNSKEHPSQAAEQNEQVKKPRAKRVSKKEKDDLGLPETMLTPSPISDETRSMQDA